MNNKIGFMQGRLCNRVYGKIQAFPWHDWENEFPVAAKIGLNLMEWTLDQDRLYQNPLMTKAGREKIKFLCQENEMSIPSLTGDCFMQKPFWKVDSQSRIDLQVDFIAICHACAEIGIGMIVIPLIDNGSIEKIEQENTLIDFLLQNQLLFEQLGLQVIFESDFNPAQLARFIARLPAKQFGINYDIGNSAALGFDPVDEFASYGIRVTNVHIKDRLLGGTTVPLTKGNADFNSVFKVLSGSNYQGNFILQTARAVDDNHSRVLANYRDMTFDWMVRYGIADL